jgi:phage major head subunit gpT-like protein
MIINQGTLQTLFVGFRNDFKRGLQSRQDPEEWQRIASLAPSESKENEYGWLGQFPSLREWVGDRHIKDMEQHGYSIKNKEYEATVGVNRPDIEDDNLGVYTPLFEEMGISARLWPNQIVYELLKNGESLNGYDGVPFFSTSHPENRGTASNLLGSGSTPWYLLDTSRSLKPLIFQRRKTPEMVRMDDPQAPNVFHRNKFYYGVYARGNAGFGFWQMALKSKDTLNQTNFDTAYAQMMQRVNDEGQSMGIRPMLLVVPPSLRSSALDLLQKQFLSNGESNRNFQIVNLLVSQYL